MILSPLPNSWKGFFLLLLSLTALHAANAQLNSSVEPGLLITDSDTVSGFISINRRHNVLKKVKFRETGESFTTYTPLSAKAFYFSATGEMFVSIRTLPANPLGDDVFVKSLISGPAQIYVFTDTTRVKYWLRKGDELVGLTGGTVEEHKVGNVNYSVVTQPHVKKIRKVLKDCTDSVNFDFSSENLVAAVERYNTCKGATSKKYSKSTKGRWVFGAALGAITSKLKFEDENAVVRPYKYPSVAPAGSYDLTSLTTETYNSMSVAGGLAISFYPGNNKHFSFVSEILYHKQSWTGERIDVELGYLQFPFTLRFNFLLKSIVQPVLGVGFDPAVNISSRYNHEDYVWTFKRASPPVPGSGDTYPNTLYVPMPTFIDEEFNPHALYPFVSAGIDIQTKKLAAYIVYRYEFSGSITKSSLYSTSVSNQNFMVCISPFKVKSSASR